MTAESDHAQHQVQTHAFKTHKNTIKGQVAHDFCLRRAIFLSKSARNLVWQPMFGQKTLRNPCQRAIFGTTNLPKSLTGLNHAANTHPEAYTKPTDRGGTTLFRPQPAAPKRPRTPAKPPWAPKCPQHAGSRATQPKSQHTINGSANTQKKRKIHRILHPLWPHLGVQTVQNP